MDKSDKIAVALLSAWVFVFFIAETLLNLTPPITRDAIIHHLAIPKLWIEHGGFYETPWADFSYYPMNINLLYVIPLLFKNDILPKFIHMGFGVGTGWMVFSYLKRKYDAVWGILGFVIFFTTPIVIWLSSSAYIDLGMTFFTTACILAFIRWRESGYDHNIWLVVSAIAMGLAVGSKYNALIAWFITNLLIVAIYARDENEQLPAVKYGFIFCFITILVASPWFVKNYILTGNPFFPLFKSFFHALNNQAPVAEMVKQTVEKTSGGGVGFFQMRGYMYGESFWETLAIPIRMFFQGDDNSYQYFQGKLNPILLVFLPFAFFKGKDRKNNFLFLAFSVFFMIMAFFLTEKQIRYQLPMVPFFSILAVCGIKNIVDFIKDKKTDEASSANKKVPGNILCGVLFLSVGLLLFLNVKYLKERFDIIKPIPYVMGRESKDDFLKRHLLHYEAVMFMNQNLPREALVFTVFFGRRGYYLDRPFFNHPNFGTSVLRNFTVQSADAKEFIKASKSLPATHIAMRTDLVDKYLSDNFSKQDVARFITLVQKHWKMLYNQNGYGVWQLPK